MGIVKVKCLGTVTDHRAPTSDSLLVQNKHEDEVLLECSSLDNSETYELGEINYECIVVGDQKFNAPYELYDLPDLNEILSVETWSYLLTDGERFALAEFLPDLNQETFWLTMKELLDGNVMFFGSPVKDFFHRIKGGFYSPEVASSRDSLHFLQRREYHYFLRQYHDSMIQKLLDMKTVWNECQESVGAEERIQIWKNKQNERPVFLVDLNAYPDEETLSKGERNLDIVPSFKKTKLWNDDHDASIPLNGLASKNHTKGKGLLKIKPTQNHSLQSLLDKSGELSMRLPKGVLKIKRKLDLERPGASSEQISSEILGSYPPGDSHSRLNFKCSEHDSGLKSSFLLQHESDRSTYRNQKLVEGPPKEDIFKARFGSSHVSQSNQRKLNLLSGTRSIESLSDDILPFKLTQNLKIYSRDGSRVGDSHKEKKIWQDRKNHRSRMYGSSIIPKIGSYQFPQEGPQERRVPNLTSESGRRISIVDIGHHEISTKPSDYFEEDQKDENDEELEMPSIDMSVSGIEKDILLPITYKRKKPHRKFIHVHSSREQADLVKLEPTLPSETIDMKPKAIKIKFKGWNSNKNSWME